MKPFVYSGIDPAIFFWSLIACTVIMFAFFIYEETWSKNYWGKAGIIRVSTIVLLWLVALTGQIMTDTAKKGGLEDANQRVVESIEAKGLRVVNGQVDASVDKLSTVDVELPLAKGAESGSERKSAKCEVFSPKDANQEIGILCDSSPNGMTLDNVIAWSEAGQPEDVSPFDNKTEETKKLVESVTPPAPTKP